MSSHKGLESDYMQLPFTREKYVFPDELVSSCSKLLAFTGWNQSRRRCLAFTLQMTVKSEKV